MKRFLNKNLIFLLIPLVSSIIIFSWFSEGKLISNTSEEDLNIYHSQKNAQYYSNFWYPYGTGRAAPFFMPRYPTFFFLGYLEQIGIPAFLRQAMLLWILMTVGIFGMYLLLKKCFGISTVFSFIGSFFYLLNIYSMTQVWKRFLYQGIFAWAYLPIFLFLWIKWIETKRIMWLFVFLLTSLFFCYTFSQPANIITIWAPAGIFVLVKIWRTRLSVNKAVIIFLRSFIALILWCLVNIWWLYPMFTLGSSWGNSWKETLGEEWVYSINTLQAVSKDFTLSDIALLRQNWYLRANNDFGSFYHNPLIILINIIPLLFVFFAVVKIKGYPHRGFLLILTFIALFISKGANFPFGYTFFYFLFSHFNFTSALRNSYEKFGTVWLLCYTLFFTIGFSKSLSLLKPSKRYFFGGGILLLILGILVLPMWTGGLFPQKHRVYVPQYYYDANNYLNKQFNSRIFHIPFLLQTEKLTYTWGYDGQDPTLNLFDPESISVPVWPIYYRIIKLLPNFIQDKEASKILGMLGVGEVILHKDSIYPKVNIEETSKYLENWEGVEEKKQFGELVIYKINKQLTRPMIYTATSMISVKTLEDGFKKIMSAKLDEKNLIFIEDEIPEIGNINIKNVPKVSFQKISNDHYLAEVNESSEPFVLVFNNTFDNLWQLKIDNQIIDKHFIVNGFANGWLIEKKDDYKIDIKLKVWPWD